MGALLCMTRAAHPPWHLHSVMDGRGTQRLEWWVCLCFIWSQCATQFWKKKQPQMFAVMSIKCFDSSGSLIFFHSKMTQGLFVMLNAFKRWLFWFIDGTVNSFSIRPAVRRYYECNLWSCQFLMEELLLIVTYSPAFNCIMDVCVFVWVCVSTAGSSLSAHLREEQIHDILGCFRIIPG